MNATLPPVDRDTASAAFFDAAARGELLVKRAPQSGMILAPEARTDPQTGSGGLEPFVASGEATLISWSIVHRAPLPALLASVPYISAIVELAEGPWLIVRIVTANPDRLRAGLEVTVRYLRSGRGDGEVIPVFTPRDELPLSADPRDCGSSFEGPRAGPGC
ncbi:MULTISPECIES: OB-fold domain-containing protein [unclassified Mycolicibacterium]|uniref:Zn-ribbon domain-containing OB-fold protein n=1 Tax=unclassified Mycolicibacterium TaxID=2636767 RepID=UPI0012DE1D2C|nr:MULTISPECIES: OB-fold domain-containing protein [unclassified Mycolicibacterium]MUL82322.1 OB-fold domain-containing protein [Mycolicibacterium sp. CBMA 329]MUL88088.1 OB-fold domain-containing protein [Mycolicibacterium sp. CBMA 331]MUM02418.1 OB-fold domain-containing protein [Mycolicibacterium sp. CBMA 334]MUM24821.1 OB-fold domain-containing protein [Mycolicibacterium sp. CBMA 295]MUM38385.1 OB-fold domain-containing protein [Mycolicibacterium sp. CBMA 247]